MTLSANIRALEKQLTERRTEPSEQAIERVLSEHAGLQVVETLLLAKQSNLLELELGRELDKEDPRYQALQDEVQEAELRLEQFRVEVREQIKSRLDLSNTAQLEDELATMKTEFEGLKITKEVLQDRIMKASSVKPRTLAVTRWNCTSCKMN